MRLIKLRKNNKRIVFVIIGSVIVFLLASLCLYNTFAVFREEKHFNVINGTVEDPGDIYFAYYVDDEITRSMPKQNTGYTLNIEKSNCTNGVIPDWDNAGWTFQANYSGYNATDYTRTRCNLYFEKTSKVVSTALGNIEVNTYTPDFSKSACDDETCESHEKGIYETLDDDGTSYYYRGSVENNYVKFAGYYWRIIRINGNGSIRLIYDGTSAHDNGESSEDRAISTSKYNSSFKDNMYVGYMYTSGNVHGLSTDSTIKVANDNFYTAKLSLYSNYLDNNVGFCGERVSLITGNSAGIDTNYIIFKTYLRVASSNPSLKCLNSLDYYTVSNASVGNKVLSYHVGLITADEAMFAGHGGGIFNGNSDMQKRNYNSYLTIDYDFWTMTAIGYYNCIGTYIIGAINFAIDSYGRLDDHFVTHELGLRPVINLKSTLKFTGDGTKNNPYVPSV